MFKAFAILVLGALGALVAFSWRDIVRYFRMEELDWGKGHPELVPIEGRTSYANQADNGAARVADFASPSRGGPAPTGM